MTLDGERLRGFQYLLDTRLYCCSAMGDDKKVSCHKPVAVMGCEFGEYRFLCYTTQGSARSHTA